MKILGILAVMLAPIVLTAQTNVEDSIFIRKIANEMLVNGQGYELLRQLTKNIGGRLAGSPQFAKAIDWGKAAMETMRPDKVFLQSCMVPHWARGGNDKASIVKVGNKTMKMSLDAYALGNSLGTGRKALVASVVAISNFEELESKKNDLKGKIVFYNVPFNPTNITPSDSYAETGVYRWTGASRAAKYGAVGMLIRSLTEANDNNPHTGGMTYNDSFPKIPAAAIGIKDANNLFKLCKSNQNVVISLQTYGKMLPDTPAFNVVAEITGKTSPNHFITVGGHLDSWDVNEGAHDDGAGVAHTLEVLRTFLALGYKPKNTIRFVLFANEENGSRGAEKYADLAKENKEFHVFGLESDAGGFTPRGFSFHVADKSWEKLESWKRLFDPYGGSHFTIGGGGADTEPLVNSFGIPVAELLPDNQRYFDLHHARTDVFENVNKRELLLGAVNIASLVYLVDKYGL